MAERFCDVGRGIRLCYETFGDPADPPLLLVMGFATQMIAWHEELCEGLAARGFHVVRFDNRDVGRSTHVDERPPTLAQIARRSRAAAPYTLDDMADDAAGLLRELGLGPAHVVGASMGGMIAQLLAIRHGDAVRSLTSIMSNTGSRLTGQPALRVYPMLLRRPQRDREAAIERAVGTYRLIGSPGELRDLDVVRELAGRAFERGYDPAGAARQLAAVVVSPNRAPQLRHIDVPTLVVHGSADRMVRPSGGRATAKAIPGARLMIVDGMGHDLPRAVWPRLIDAIAENAARADEQPRAA